MKKNYRRKLIGSILLFLFFTVSNNIYGMSTRTWADDFDGYINGQILDGTPDDGDWKCWNNQPEFYATVTSQQSRSNPHSMKIEVNTDIVHEYSGYTSGEWNLTAWQYIPTDFTGDTYFIMLCAYDGGHSGTVWTVQIHWNSETNLVISDYNNEQTSVIYGRWVEIRCEIDLNDDWLEIYYDNTLFVAHKWTDTVFGDGAGGILNIAAVDFYANGSSMVFYDDISLSPIFEEELICDAGGPYNSEIYQEIQFTGFACGGTEPYSWMWDFDDGYTSTLQNPIYFYDTPGIYNVTLTVTDADFNSAMDTTTVTINEPVPPTPPTLEIVAITGNFGRFGGIQALVKNKGDIDAIKVNWSITLDGGIIILGKETSSTLSILSAGEEKTISSDFIFGFGRTTVRVTVECPESSDVLDRDAFVFLFFTSFN